LFVFYSSIMSTSLEHGLCLKMGTGPFKLFSNLFIFNWFKQTFVDWISVIWRWRKVEIFLLYGVITFVFTVGTFFFLWCIF
jgi:hypothetical protein